MLSKLIIFLKEFKSFLSNLRMIQKGIICNRTRKRSKYPKNRIWTCNDLKSIIKYKKKCCDPKSDYNLINYSIQIVFPTFSVFKDNLKIWDTFDADYFTIKDDLLIDQRLDKVPYNPILNEAHQGGYLMAIYIKLT